MSTAQWILNLALLGWVLYRNLGTHRVSRSTVLVPLTVVLAVAGWIFHDLPTAGHDIELELIGAAAGLVFGLAATALTRTRRHDGQLVSTAGAAFAAVWVIAIGGRMLFAQWATHSGARIVSEFSLRHQISGADAWAAGFIVMALTMVTVRLVVTAVQVLALRSTSTATMPEAAPGLGSRSFTDRDPAGQHADLTAE